MKMRGKAQFIKQMGSTFFSRSCNQRNDAMFEEKSNKIYDEKFSVSNIDADINEWFWSRKST